MQLGGAPDDPAGAGPVQSSKTKLTAGAACRVRQIHDLPSRIKHRCGVDAAELRVVKCIEPGFLSFWLPGHCRLYTRLPPFPLFFILRVLSDAGAPRAGASLASSEFEKTRKCLISSDFSYTSPSPSFLRPVYLPAATLIRSARPERLSHRRITGGCRAEKLCLVRRTAPHRRSLLRSIPLGPDSFRKRPLYPPIGVPRPRRGTEADLLAPGPKRYSLSTLSSYQGLCRSW